MDPKTIAVLVESCRRQDSRAQHTLWNLVAGPLFAWVKSRFPRFQEADGRAIACEAFARALLRLHKLESASHFVTWLFSIAEHIAKDYVADEELRDDDIALESVPETAFRRRPQQDDTRTFDDHLLELLRAAFIVLTPDQATVVVWRLRTRLDRAGISRRLGKSVEAVDMLFMRGMERVRRVLRIRTEGRDLLSAWEEEDGCAV